MTACASENVERVVTANVEVGGADGVKTGYFEVELTHSGDDEIMWCLVGMYRPDLGQGEDGWVLSASSGGRHAYGTDHDDFEDHQGMLNVGDRVGVLVDLEEKDGRQGGSIQFFVNGVKFGSGFESRVTGPLVLGVEMHDPGQKVTLLPDAQRTAAF
jgi:hypothetical protein